MRSINILLLFLMALGLNAQFQPNSDPPLNPPKPIKLPKQSLKLPKGEIIPLLVQSQALFI